MAPENRWLEDYFPFGMAHFPGLMIVWRDGNFNDFMIPGMAHQQK